MDESVNKFKLFTQNMYKLINDLLTLKEEGILSIHSMFFAITFTYFKSIISNLMNLPQLGKISTTFEVELKKNRIVYFSSALVENEYQSNSNFLYFKLFIFKYKKTKKQLIISNYKYKNMNKWSEMWLLKFFSFSKIKIFFLV
jgi:hypothetical protein